MEKYVKIKFNPEASASDISLLLFKKISEFNYNEKIWQCLNPKNLEIKYNFDTITEKFEITVFLSSKDNYDYYEVLLVCKMQKSSFEFANRILLVFGSAFVFFLILNMMLNSACYDLEALLVLLVSFGFWPLISYFDAISNFFFLKKMKKKRLEELSNFLCDEQMFLK